MQYNLKKIKVIPVSTDLIDIILSKTQRKTPTVTHPGQKISRIRKFYMRKVKYCSEEIDEKLGGIVNEFPNLKEIHPFQSDLINILQDHDHQKLALGHINTAKGICKTICSDYVRLMKQGDSLFRVKTLKRAALGRMMTTLKKLKSSLSQLEEIRKHMSRLPSIDPMEKTLIISGFPNVGKSSFINSITNANVDVQDQAFTTKSLFVGHTDFNYSRYQIIDTPGILDHPLEERNTIEMQSIAALAHLDACILFMMDISETCNQTIKDQLNLFNSILPLFKNKPIVIVGTKVDLVSFEELTEENKHLINTFLNNNSNIKFVCISVKSGIGIGDLKKCACDILLNNRLNKKYNDKKIDEILNRITVVQPKLNDTKIREYFIPENFNKNNKKDDELLQTKSIKELADENGGNGVFYIPKQFHYELENLEWKYDKVPEIMDGHNINDFIDKDIFRKLEEIEREEQMLLDSEMPLETNDQTQKDLIREKDNIRNQWKMKTQERKLDNSFKPKIKNLRDMEEMPDIKNSLKSKIKKSEKMEVSSSEDDNIRTKSRRLMREKLKSMKDNRRVRSRSEIRKKQKQDDEIDDDEMKDVEYSNKIVKVTDEKLKQLKFKMEKRFSKKDEGKIFDQKPKHLFSGKLGRGKRDRR